MSEVSAVTQPGPASSTPPPSPAPPRPTPGASSLLQAPFSKPSAAHHPSSKKKHNPWSTEETSALVDGVAMCGIGKWADIKRLQQVAISGVLAGRSPVDLKDKWRNLVRGLGGAGRGGREG
jgi:hypothetical protein